MLRHPADLRQLAIVALYLALLAAMQLVPDCRNLPLLLLACWLSFLNAVVIHNVMHEPPFEHPFPNEVLRLLLSFGNLYPASANIPSHNRVHHRFSDEGLPDWAAPEQVELPHPLLALIHFPNVVGPETFAGVGRYAQRIGRGRFRERYRRELVFAVGLTALCLIADLWTGLLFLVVPQLWGARSILRINLIQHGGTDPHSSEHSRSFVGRAFNFVMMNNGYHAIHHDHPSLHWSKLRDAHREHPRSLEEKSMLGYLLRTFLWRRS